MDRTAIRMSALSSHWFTTALLLLSWQYVLPNAAHADAISPGITEQDSVYSEEKANTSFYGTGPAGQLTEASELRFQAEELLREGKFDLAIKKSLKAVQFDQADADSHLLLARALTAKITRSKTIPDHATIQQAIAEWKLLWHHDANQLNQTEAKMQARRLTKLAKMLEKQEKLQLAGQEEHSF